MFIFIFANWNLPWAHKTTTYQKPFDNQRSQRWVIVCSVIADFKLRIQYKPRLYFIAKLTLSVYHLIRFWFFLCVHYIYGVMTSLNGKWFGTDDDLDQLQSLSLPWLMECERVNYFAKGNLIIKSTLMNFNLKCMNIMIIHA